jgi:hypothetical protein
MTTPVFKIRSVYNFDTLAPSILGSTYKGVTVLGQIDATLAATMEDVPAVHAQVFSFLQGSGTPNNYKAYDYILIQTASGQKRVLGIPWIDANSIVEVTSRTIVATITNVTATDLPRIQAALVQNGFNNVTLAISD